MSIDIANPSVDSEPIPKRPRRNPKMSWPFRIQSLFHNTNKPTLSSNMTLLHQNPSIYKIHSLCSNKELAHLTTLCNQYSHEFEPSFTEDHHHLEHVTDYRTSHYIHLSKGQDQYIRNIERKAANLIGLKYEQVEPLQIVSYENGQFFDTHHDAGTLMEDGEVELVYPRRLITIFLYLTTLPPNQGHTEFPEIGLSVTPERGSALLFSNITATGEPDKRVLHRACPVTDGYKKHGVNIWLSEHSMQELVFIQSSKLIKVDKRERGRKQVVTTIENTLSKPYKKEVEVEIEVEVKKEEREIEEEEEEK